MWPPPPPLCCSPTHYYWCWCVEFYTNKKWDLLTSSVGSSYWYSSSTGRHLTERLRRVSVRRIRSDVMIKSITQSASLLTTCRLTLHLEQQKQSEIVHTLICKLSRFEDPTLLIKEIICWSWFTWLTCHTMCQCLIIHSTHQAFWE